jgi:prevent-host-death family protein
MIRRAGIVRSLSIREMRGALPRLEELVEKEGELLVTRRGRPIARVVPWQTARLMPSHADLRAALPTQAEPSEALVRAERDER